MVAETRFNMWDDVWVMRDNKPTQYKIQAIEVFRDAERLYIKYHLDRERSLVYPQRMVAATKEELKKLVFDEE